jgi:hypothetical protein
MNLWVPPGGGKAETGGQEAGMAGDHQPTQ